MIRRGRRVWVPIGCVVALMLGGCSKTGDDAAADRVDQVAESLRLRWIASQAYAPELAAQYVSSGAIDLVLGEHPDDKTEIVPVRWSGTSDSDGAQIDLRITVAVPEDPQGGRFGTTREAGEATACYRYTIVGNRNDDQVTRSKINCPSGPDPALPAPVKAPALPKDAKARVARLLRAADADSLQRSAKAEFLTEAKNVFVDSAASRGRLIVTVGLVGGGDCLVAIRARDGKITFPDIPRDWLQPGETGCHPALIISPPV